MDYSNGIPALEATDPLSLTPQYSQELRTALGYRRLTGSDVLTSTVGTVSRVIGTTLAGRATFQALIVGLNLQAGKQDTTLGQLHPPFVPAQGTTAVTVYAEDAETAVAFFTGGGFLQLAYLSGASTNEALFITGTFVI